MNTYYIHITAFALYVVHDLMYLINIIISIINTYNYTYAVLFAFRDVNVD